MTELEKKTIEQLERVSGMLGAIGETEDYRDVILHQSCATKQEKKAKYEAETGGLVCIPSRLIIPTTNNLFLQEYLHSFRNNLIPQLHINILY